MKLIKFQQHVLLSVVAVLLTAAAVGAAPIDLSINNPDRIGAPGDVIKFDGTITNNTADPISSTDLFLNFSGFDSLNMALDQVLGLTAFTIANGATLSLVDLFTISLASTTPVGMYPADVVLATAGGELSDAQSVSVRVVPEPGMLALIGMALFSFFLVLLRLRFKLAIPILVGILAIPQVSMGQVSSVRFSTSPPGLGKTGSTLMIAIPITNQGSVNATNVQVTAATLRTAPLTAPSSFPIALGSIAPNQSAVFQANVDARLLAQNVPYLFTVRGTYQVGSVTAGFAVNRFITIPPASPGLGNVKTGTVGPNFVSGAPYPAKPPHFDDKVNIPRPPIPTGPFIPGARTPSGTGAVAFQPSPGLRAGIRGAAPVIFNVNNSVGFTSAGTNCNPGVAPASCAEPSGATGGGVVFVTANWTAAYSTDGGNTFTQINPTTIFPADAIGFCCDQVVQYIPSIDRFIWLLQGSGVRIASASPAQIKSSGGTAWTYWNLTPGVYGQPAGTGFDYPDISVGSNNLYLSWDVGFPSCPAGCNSGFEVSRIPLAQIAASGTIFFDFTTPSDSALAWGSHLTQNTGDEIFWAGHDGNSSLRVFSLAEGSNRYFWRNVDISSWPNNTLTSTTPDSQDWLKFGFPGNSVIGATRTSSQIWFAWTAGTNDTFAQPHVQMVALDRGNNFKKTQQVQIWNSGYAFAYPALATNVCTDEVGLSLGYGGNGNYENHVVGIWGDFVVFVTSNSNLGVNRYGDYLTIRQNTLSGFDGLFNAFGYGIRSVPGGGMQSDVRFVTFGRSCQLQ